MSICLNPTSAAGKRYTRGVALTMIGYMFAVLGTTTYVRNHHPQGIEVYFLAALPALCILGMLIVMAIYLRDEKDEFQRMLIVRSLLWATFATLALSAYNDLLISYESPHTLPPFSQFIAFWITFGLVQAVQSLRLRRAAND